MCACAHKRSHLRKFRASERCDDAILLDRIVARRTEATAAAAVGDATTCGVGHRRGDGAQNGTTWRTRHTDRRAVRRAPAGGIGVRLQREAERRHAEGLVAGARLARSGVGGVPAGRLARRQVGRREHGLAGARRLQHAARRAGAPLGPGDGNLVVGGQVEDAHPLVVRDAPIAIGVEDPHELAQLARLQAELERVEACHIRAWGRRSPKLANAGTSAAQAPSSAKAQEWGGIEGAFGFSARRGPVRSSMELR